MADKAERIPVVLDTDIGLDVDDVWALAFLLNCPELDIKLITTSTGNTGYRAKIVAKMLQIAGREDIPIGVGIPLDDSPETHSAWLGDFSLSDYAGDVLRDGVGAICETIIATPEIVSLVCIGPLPNIAAALAREPDLTTSARFIGMHGSLRRGYMGADKPMREYNVKQHALACQAVFKAKWEKTITPLDTCGTVMLQGERFARIRDSDKPLTKAVMDNHAGWFEAVKEWPMLKDLDARVQSSVLYDCVAVYLAFSHAHLQMETLPIIVTNDGKTLIDEAGEETQCATDWIDKEAFLDLLTERLVQLYSVLTALRIFSYLPNPRVFKAMIAAELCGASLEIVGDKPAKLAHWLWDYDARELSAHEQTADSPHARSSQRGFTGTLYKTDAFLASQPFGTVPCAFSPGGDVGIFESNSILRAVVRLSEQQHNLYGTDGYSASRVDSFLDASLVFAREAQVYLLGMSKMQEQTHARMASAYEFYMQGVENALQHTSHLVDNNLSIADIAFVCDLAQFLREGHYKDELDGSGFTLISDQALQQYPTALGHMLALSETPAFRKHMGTYLDWYRRQHDL